jgi:hypothetical protein
MICTVCKILFCDQTRKYEVGGAYGASGGERKCLQEIGVET